MVDQQMKLFEDGGLNQQGGQVDEISGNEVPAGSLKEEVRDDIDAKLSEGEFVMPADVVRYIGLETLMKLRDKAKAGLARMEDIGQMGNADEVANPDQMHGGEMPQEDDTQFASAVDQAMSEVDGGEQQFAEGGYVKMADGGDVPSITQQSPGTGAPLTKFAMKPYTNAAGQTLYVPFLGTEPLLTIPAGYTEGTVTPAETPTTVQPTAGIVKPETGPADATGDVVATTPADFSTFGQTPAGAPAVGPAVSAAGLVSTGVGVPIALNNALSALNSYSNAAFGLLPGAGLAGLAAYGVSNAVLSAHSNAQDMIDSLTSAGINFSTDANGTVVANPSDLSYLDSVTGYETGINTVQDNTIDEGYIDSTTGYESSIAQEGMDVGYADSVNGPESNESVANDVGYADSVNGPESDSVTDNSGPSDSGSSDTSGAVGDNGDLAKGGFVNKKHMNKNKKKGIGSRK